MKEDNAFHNCPWPVSPSMILSHLPIEEESGVRNRESVLRQITRRDKTRSRSSEWAFTIGYPAPEAT